MALLSSTRPLALMRPRPLLPGMVWCRRFVTVVAPSAGVFGGVRTALEEVALGLFLRLLCGCPKARWLWPPIPVPASPLVIRLALRQTFRP